jgi:hypothetical protein
LSLGHRRGRKKRLREFNKVFGGSRRAAIVRSGLFSMAERIIYTALFALTLLVLIHAMLHVFEVEHPNIPEWLFPGGLTLTATWAYSSTRLASDRPVRLLAAI